MLKKMGKKLIKPNAHKVHQCTCGHCNNDDDAMDNPGIVAVKSSSVQDLERDELMIYRAVKPSWNDKTPFSYTFNELESISITVAKGMIKKELSALYNGGEVYDVIPVNIFAEYPFELTKEYIITEYIPRKLELMEQTNTKWREEGNEVRIYAESRLFALCIDQNTELDSLVKMWLQYTLQAFPTQVLEYMDRMGM